MKAVFEAPAAGRRFNFFMHRMALGEQAPTLRIAVFFHVAEEAVQGCEGTRGEYVGVKGRQSLDTGLVNGYGYAHVAGGLAQKDAFPQITVDEGDISPGVCCESGDDKAGESGASTEVGPGPSRRSPQKPKLGGVSEVARPSGLFGAAADEVYSSIPLQEYVVKDA